LSLFPIILLAIAVSLDGLGAGLACGLKQVRIPFLSVVLIGAAAGGAVLISMLLGAWLGGFFYPKLAGRAGGLILAGLGLYMLGQALRGGEAKGLFGLLHDPAKADADNSGSIRGHEAVVLGVALALDGFGAGFGAALAGLSPAATGLAVALANVAFVSAGLHLGRMVSPQAQRHMMILPGLIILVLGALKIAL
jgi:putative Mn2+ efflux pump MntP